jgi:S-adenosylmethionine:tRNA ribosyltransferase-isomerase
MRVSDFDYVLPPELVAQEPLANRDAARLLVLDRSAEGPAHRTVADLPALLRPGDLLVVNDARVFPARLLGRREPSGGKVECLLLERHGDGTWEALVHPGQKLRVGERIVFEGAGGEVHGEILHRRFFGRRLLRLWTEGSLTPEEVIERIGHMPLPPYIKRPDRPEDRERYQTMFARVSGSVAAPTAGLHFSTAMVEALARTGVTRADITLHVGYGTFKPVRSETAEGHVMDREAYEIGPEAADRINLAIEEGRRVIAVGTTTTRALESAALAGGGRVPAGAASTDLFIYPGFEFRVIGGLLTNFHLPKSSLLMLVSAFGGRERVLAAYREAVARRYRFYSYGDAMLLL